MVIDAPSSTPRAVRLEDYAPPDYRVESADLYFELHETETRVRATLAMVANYDHAQQPSRPLVLDGESLTLVSLAVDGEALDEDAYRLDDSALTVDRVPGAFTLEVETVINPRANTALEGLYLSGGNFCTQCEAQGFRRITYFPDRPDVMARFTTTVVADKARYPVLLSNGNPEQAGELEDGRHWVRWSDPFPKPCYLFALVAGDLARIEDQFVTMSGRKVHLHLYVQRHNLDQCDHAMNALKKAMEWDEETYGREYDLDLFMIVAVDDFNMGAMENKGLNIFNSSCVLAKAQTATDANFQRIENVVGHEYFHNWSGNRVTCRDWFQLSLKEGFTVFRDQEFSADIGSRGVKRIQDVDVLRIAQFREDAGPMAHPVRPDAYVEIGNFYTATVYIKGAEVIRMMQRLLGQERFRQGTDLYFERHDGQAVTTDDFVKAMEDASGVDLGQFRRWYTQAGTPRLQVERAFDPEARRYTLTVRQSCPATPGQPQKQPFHIPLATALLDNTGRELPLRLAGEARAGDGNRVLEVFEPEQTFVFEDVNEEPVPSLLRGFSAPVHLDLDLSETELAFLMAHDTDPFNRWEAGQRLALGTLLALVEADRRGEPTEPAPALVEAFGAIARAPGEDRALAAECLTLPSETYVGEFLEVIDPDAVHGARRFLRRSLAEALREPLLALYDALADPGPYTFDADAVGRRSLRNLCLGYLMELDEAAIRSRCVEQFHGAGNMTDAMASLRCLANEDSPEREEALAAFYETWREEPLVIDKWFSIQATSRLPDTLNRVRALMEHPAFNLRNPNRVRALVGAFCQGNPVRFHEPGGAGYRFVADQVLTLDGLNPQIAARLAGAFAHWRRYDADRQALMKGELERILAGPGLSRDTYEIVSKSLA